MNRLFFALTFILFYSCSLKYGTNYPDDSSIPEFVFTDATFNKYEDNKKTMSLSASKLEQYSNGNDMYAKDVQFSVINSEGEVTTEGSCEILSANSKDEKYVLYNQIEINSIKDGIKISADSLRWNGKTEQLTSSRNDLVTIKKDGTTLNGSGFSASAISKEFNFSGVTSGMYESEEDTTEEESAEEVSNEE